MADHISNLESARQTKRDAPAAPAAPDERDATIERLDRELAEERQNSAKLRNTVDDLRFKADILEKSYAKQLADARLRSATAEQQLADQQVRVTALETSREETVRALAETRAQLELATSGREQRDGPARGEARQTKAAAPHASEAEVPEGTINELMANLKVLRGRQPEPESHLHSRVSDEPQVPSGDMLPPELVFPKKDGNKS